MKSTLDLGVEKKKYFFPVIELIIFNQLDVLCTSKDEEFDNEFDASGMGNF